MYHGFVLYVCINTQDPTYIHAKECNRHWCYTMKDIIKECRFFFNTHKDVSFLFIKKYKIHPNDITQTIKYYKIYRNNMKRIVKQLYYVIKDDFDQLDSLEIIKKCSIKSNTFLSETINVLDNCLSAIAENSLAHVTKNIPVASYDKAM